MALAMNVESFQSNSVMITNRVTELLSFFKAEFGSGPLFFVQVPGRVNIIGEHVDYCGYPVLPMALEQTVLLAVGKGDNRIELRNLNSSKYLPYSCELTDPVEIKIPKTGGPEWYNYFLCGIQGIFDNLDKSINRNGLKVAVSGNIPPSAGLSSSSALVCAAALATGYMHQFVESKSGLATISAKAEHYIGTVGGGMDQAIAFLATKGCAQFIEWNPLRTTSVILPRGVKFVIANSLSEANKAASSDFNKRVVECRLAARVIAKTNKLNWRDIDKLAILQQKLNLELDAFEEVVDNGLTKYCYSREDLLSMLDVSENEFMELYLTPNTQTMQSFKLRQRALHVVQESIRVIHLREAAECGNISMMQKVMKMSHESLKELYECSHPNLDRLVELCSKQGCGARLTGAGWGGCIVALCDSDMSANILVSKLKDQYYKDLPQVKGRNLDDVVFMTSPQDGAHIFDIFN